MSPCITYTSLWPHYCGLQFYVFRNTAQACIWTNIWRDDKSLARSGRKQANVSVRMAWISFGALPCRKKKCMEPASLCCWNRAPLWHTSEPLSFLVGLRTYQHPGKYGSLRPRLFDMNGTACGADKKSSNSWFQTFAVFWMFYASFA